MSTTPGAKPPILNPPLSPERTLRRLFLTLFLRGRSSRGLQKAGAPKSVGSKLALTLVVYALFGAFAFFFQNQPVLVLSLYLHSMTFVFLGMFVAASAGEVLFNKEEGDILLHRPVTPQALLRAKITVLVQISLWLAASFNLAGFFIGVGTPDGGWLYPLVHAASTVLEALFCTGCVVMVYQLCLRWFGRERLDGLMTTAQVLAAVAMMVVGQIVPRLMGGFGSKLGSSVRSWWVSLLPPAWFAGVDDAIAGSGALNSWVLAALAVTATPLVLWLAFGKLARDYEKGLQMLGETLSQRPKRNAQRRWLDALVNAPPLSWWLRDPVSRASFLLTAAYLMRDRDVKLRVYPGVAPMLVMPLIFLIQDRSHGSGGFGVAFSGFYLGLIPLLAIKLLQYSQQWQAADLFRAVPILGPAPLCHGARRAVLLLLTLPVLFFFALIAWLMRSESSHLLLLLPGLVALPVYALIPSLGGHAVPLSVPTEEGKSAARAVSMIVVMIISAVLAGLSLWAWSTGWFAWFLLVETILAIGVYFGLRASLTAARWQPME
jgi:ABC-2 type transport system permease protein